MALALKILYTNYKFLFNEYKDPRVENYPLLDSPAPIIGIIAAYVFFVLSYGPSLMKNKRPFELKWILLVYNATQILSNLFIGTVGIYYYFMQKNFNFACQLIHHDDNEGSRRLVFATYLYFAMKIIDLLDTVFYVMRKKNNQITFLHVYHHAGMVLGTYIFTKFLAGSHSTFLGIINSYVHVIMYSYYFLTSFKPELKQSLWWKKHITQVQLIQFFVLIIHFAVPIFLKTCKHNKTLLMIGVIQNLFMFVLFSDFYIKAYIKKKNI